MKRMSVVITVLLIMIFCSSAYLSGQESAYNKSLHYTTEGMRYWYETEGGFMDITDIPYADLDCKTCHAANCDVCHAKKSETGTVAYNTSMANNSEICLHCHKRAAATFNFAEKLSMQGVHSEAGMACTDCHQPHDLHGDGKAYTSMRDLDNPRAACADCHEPDMDIRPHKVHKGKLDCNACHVQFTTTCMNCHFEKFLETGTRKGHSLPIASNIYLINYNGKVTTANLQSLVHEGEKFVVYAPYFTHSIKTEGHSCQYCHGTDLAKAIKNGETVDAIGYDDGQYQAYDFAVPIVADQLQWPFLDKNAEGWVFIDDGSKAQEQFACYGTPLTKEQIRKLAMPFKK